jgi:hypothetical protein
MTNTSTMICTSCGNPRDPSAAYCVSCGAATQPAPSAQAPGNSPPPPPAPPPPPFAVPPPGTTPPGFIVNEHPASLTQRGLFGSLFDVTFTSLVTTKLVRVLYVVAMIWIGLTALFYIIVGFHLSTTAGILTLFIFVPVTSLFLLGLTRILLETCIALFQIMANSNEIVAQGRSKASA